MDCPLGRSTHLACTSSSPCLSSLGLPRLSPACGTAHHHRPLATRFGNRVQTRAPPPVGLHRPLHEPPAQTAPRFWARRAHCSVRHRPTLGAPPGTPRRTLPVRAPAPGQRGSRSLSHATAVPEKVQRVTQQISFQAPRPHTRGTPGRRTPRDGNTARGSAVDSVRRKEVPPPDSRQPDPSPIGTHGDRKSVV